MRIGVDALPLTGPRTGVGNYIFYILEELVVLLPDCQFYLYAPFKRGDIEHFARYPNVKICIDGRASKILSLWEQTTLAHRLFWDRIDVFWATAQSFPLMTRKKMKILFTVHDFVYLLYADMMASSKRQRMLKFLMPLFLKRADYILPNSHGTAARLKQHYNRKHHAVVEPPLKPWLQPIEPGRLRSWLSKKGLVCKDYLLSVGTLEPRKNFDAILAAFLSIMEKNEPDAVLPLVVMGGEGWKNSNLKGLFEKLKQKYPEKFIITGYASEEDQWFYLAGARYLLLLSHYEGYGMPIAEARVCGTEVVCTDIPEMREAALGQGIFLSKEEVTEKLPPFFLRSHRLSKRNAIANYPNNREKAERMIDIINRIKDQKEAVVR